MLTYVWPVLAGLAGLVAGVLVAARIAGRPLRAAWRPTVTGPRDVLVPLTCAGAFVAFTLRFGLTPALPAYLYLAVVGVALAAIDVVEFRLPDRLTLPSYPVALALLAGAAVFEGWWSLLTALIGMAALWVLYALLFLVSGLIGPGAFGWGDVKLAGVLGIYLGWLGAGACFAGTFYGVLLGGLFALALVISRRGTRKTAIPFGPFMLAGALIAILVN